MLARTVMTAAVLIVTVSVNLAAAPITNLVPDPGFEDRSWTLAAWEVCEYKAQYVDETRSGEVAIQLTGIKPGERERISVIATGAPFAVEGGKEYLLSLWTKSDGPAPSVSIMSFKEPFATAQWKTPQASYNTYSLPAADEWTLWSIRYTMPKEAVEAVVLPRLTAAGSVWFDDICLVPADQVALEFTTTGELTAFPDTRRFTATVSPVNEALRFDLLHRQSGAVLHSSPVAPDIEISSAVENNEVLDAVVVEPKTNSVLAHTVVQVPPVVEFTLHYPRYRRSVFATDDRSEAVGVLRINAAPEPTSQVSWSAALISVDAAMPVFSPPQTALREQEISLPLRETSVGRQMVFYVTANTPVGKVYFKETFTILPSAPEGVREVTVGPDNELRVDGRPFFARGFMGGGPDVFGPVKETGHNIGSTFGGTVENALAYLDGMHELGMYGITGMVGSYVKTKDLEGLRAAVRQVRDHPALLGYYFPDEPSPAKEGMHPDDWQPFYDLMVEEDPYHPVMTTMYNPEFADDYENCLDILLFDPYPIRTARQPLTVVSDFIVRARKLVDDRKPIWAVPQAFGYDVVEGLDKPPTWLTPTPEEARCMTWLFVATGAQGILYYCYHVYTEYDAALREEGKWPWKLGGYLPEKQPELWGALAAIGEELKVLEDALNRPGHTWQKDGIFGREMPPAADADGYLLVVNPSETQTVQTRVTLRTPLANIQQLRTLAGERNIDVTGENEVEIQLEPMGTGIYILPHR